MTDKNNVTKLYASQTDLDRLARSIVRLARFALMEAPKPIIDKELDLIRKRQPEIGFADNKRIITTVENEIVKTVAENFLSGAACFNCQSFYICPKIDAENTLNPFPYPSGAALNCTEYVADAEKFDTAASNLPRILELLNTTGTNINKIRVAAIFSHFITVWLKELIEAGKLPQGLEARLKMRGVDPGNLNI